MDDLYGDLLPKTTTESLKNNGSTGWGIQLNVPSSMNSKKEPDDQSKTEVRPKPPQPSPRTTAMGMVPSALNVKRKQQVQQSKPAPFQSEALTSAKPAPASSGTNSAVAEISIHLNLAYQVTENEYDPMFPNNYEAFCNEQVREEKQKNLMEELAKREIILEEQRQRERTQIENKLKSGQMASVSTTVGVGEGRNVTNLPAWMVERIEKAQLQPSPQIEKMVEPHQPSISMPDSSVDEFGRVICATRKARDHRIEDHRRVSPKRPKHHSSSRSRRSRSPQVSHRRSNPRPDSDSAHRTILLQNMVGLGQVDDALMNEVKAECSATYGSVETCRIEKIQGVSDSKAVKIFVTFYEPQAAKDAVKGLHNRYFGGRHVQASVVSIED